MKKLLAVVDGQNVWPPPLWLMRQAGRYLPEYRSLREKAGSFWSLCMNPELAAEVTLQPIRRFGFDGAIIFSDILVIPRAFGIDVRIEEGLGPRLEPIENANVLSDKRELWDDALAPCYAALRRVREQLSGAEALIGFAGAPWTLATYLAAGQGSPDQRAAKLWSYRNPQGFELLVDKLAEGIARHLVAQIDAGADLVQIFDSWAGGLPAAAFRRWVIAPTKRIVEAVRKERKNARIIGFPRSATLDGYRAYAEETGVDAISLDTSVPMEWAARSLPPRTILQGNLDPIGLLAGGDALDEAIDSILAAMRSRGFVFNLGHGVLPETPIAHVEQLVRRVKAG